LTATRFRRAGIVSGTVEVETGTGEVWYLPNPPEGGKPYNPETVLRAVIKAQRVNLDLWRRTS
jgi:hypothetical protein